MAGHDHFPVERLLVATDGEPTADAALLVTKLLAQRHTASVDVIGVFSPRIPLPVRSEGEEPRCERRDRRALVILRRRIRHQLRDRIGVDWPVHVCVGHPPARIAALARSKRASLVVLGHTPPTDTSDRRLGRHTMEQVAIACDVPVLAVPSDLVALPSVIVTVNDDSSVAEAGRATAAAVLADGGRLDESREPVGRKMLHHAEAMGAELVVLPLHGHTTTIRSLMGGSVMDVLDHARCAVLITPEAA